MLDIGKAFDEHTAMNLGTVSILGSDEWEQKSDVGGRLVRMEERSMSARTPHIEALCDG
jgi:hypothetical protein